MSFSFGDFSYDFDFNGDKSNKLAPFIIGFLMYSVTIAIMSGFFTHNLTSRWKDALNGRVTVEFQSNINGAGEVLTDKQIEEILKTIKGTKGVKFVRKLGEADILKVLEPWLSGTAIPDDFPFPAIFDVETDRGVKTDLLSLRDSLSKISYGVKIHDHANWYAPIAKISDGLFGFAIILSVLIFATVCVTMVFITKKTLATHLNAVKILQLIGANNSYIASQFKRYYFAVGCKSSLISIVCSFLTIFGIIFISSAEPLSLTTLNYAAVAIIVPLIATMLVMITSKNTVLFFLKNDKWVD
jgi:cell division transport system permease protein